MIIANKNDLPGFNWKLVKDCDVLFESKYACRHIDTSCVTHRNINETFSILATRIHLN
jgi:hypothetical protein